MRNIALFAAISALMLGLTGASLAGPGNLPPTADITRADYLKAAEARFDKLDTNHDGVLSREEMTEARKTMRPRDFRHRGKGTPDRKAE